MTQTPLPSPGSLDTSSSASRQHYIDTGRYLTHAEVAEFATGPALTMAPTLFVVVITGPGIDEPVIDLAGSRQRAVEVFAEHAREILTAHLDYTPLRIQEDKHPDGVTVADVLTGFGFDGIITEREVSL